MITEQYVSLEIAVLLKDKGFNETCRAYWGGFNNKPLGLSECNRGRAFDYCTNSSLRAYNDCEQTYIAAPTHQMTLAWLREKYNLMISIFPYNDGFMFGIYNETGALTLMEINKYSNYDDAVEGSILYCFKHLKHIVK